MTNKEKRELKNTIESVLEIPKIIFVVLGIGGLYGTLMSLVLGLFFVKDKFFMIALLVYGVLFFVSKLIVDYIEERFNFKWSEEVSNSMRGWIIYLSIFVAIKFIG